MPRLRPLVTGAILDVAFATFTLAYATADVARAQTAEAPSIKAGDSWTYLDSKNGRGRFAQSSDSITVERTSPSLLTVDIKAVGSDLPPKEQILGADWSRIRNVDGQQATVAKPLSFPMAIGKSWTVDFTESNPNRLHTREQFHLVYEVKDWEDVTVPAGTFKALKIEAEGDWAADVPARTSSASGAMVDSAGAAALSATTRQGAKTFTGHLYKAIWYVPSVRRWVKAVEEVYDAGGVRSERVSSDLVSFKLAEPTHAVTAP